MGSATRAEAARLRGKYAKASGISEDLVQIQEAPDEDTIVSCPSRPELPGPPAC